MQNNIDRLLPIKTVRVSSAQAQGAAKAYPYWGAARYEIRRTKNGGLSNCVVLGATSDRRSIRLAEADAARIAEAEGRIPCQKIGPMTEDEVLRLITAHEKVGSAVGDE